MSSEKYFITAAGYCYILPEYLVITDHSDPKEILRRKDSDSIPLFRVGLHALAIGMMIYLVFEFNSGHRDVIFTILPAIIFCFYLSVRWGSRSNIAVIERSDIRNVQLKKIMFTPTFVVLFKNKKGKLRERLISMKSNESRHISEALNLLFTEGLMNDKSINASMETEVQKEKKPVNKADAKQVRKAIPESEDQPSIPSSKRDADGYMKDY